MPDTTRHNPTPAAVPARVPRSGLSPAQEAALAALVAGQSVTATAAAVGVARCTVHAWLRDDYAFKAAYNRGRKDLHAIFHARLMSLAAKAAGCVERALDAGDARAALALLRGLGLLTGAPAAVGSDDPQVLEDQAGVELLMCLPPLDDGPGR
jgi:hypothetical protein